MTPSITAVGAAAPINRPMSIGQAAGPASSAGQTSFQELLLQSLDQVNSADQTGRTAIEQPLIGGDLAQVEVLSTVKQADLALNMLVQVRDRILEAYNEVKHMQL